MSEKAASRRSSKAGSPAAAASSPPAVTEGQITAHLDVEIDAEDPADNDSVFDTASLASSTTSVNESILNYRTENGRTYHRYKEGKYMYPNDEQEVDRLDLQHNMYLLTFDNKLGTAPPNDMNSHIGRVLDCGTGSGIWAIEFGDEHPEAEVLGVDLSANFPEYVPPNVKFEIDDIEEPWTWSRPFDYIHSRMMTSAINDWRTYIAQCYDHLNPGGYLELNDADVNPLSDDGTLKPDSALSRCMCMMAEASEILGRPFVDVQGLKDVMVDVGFEDVHVHRFKWPTNPWARHSKYKELGFWCEENFAGNWEGIIMAPFTRGLKWTREETMVFAMEVRKELKDRSIHAYFSIWSIYGRKPGGR
ncbi:Secondary metabolism regulator LAE1 [Colletotrichum siamense]|nr:Secondary metabolism regulator LAE1 [Colletotrichum siamense]